jgi:hypothetical protein
MVGSRGVAHLRRRSCCENLFKDNLVVFSKEDPKSSDEKEWYPSKNREDCVSVSRKEDLGRGQDISDLLLTKSFFNLKLALKRKKLPGESVQNRRAVPGFSPEDREPSYLCFVGTNRLLSGLLDLTQRRLHGNPNTDFITNLFPREDLLVSLDHTLIRILAFASAEFWRRSGRSAPLDLRRWKKCEKLFKFNLGRKMGSFPKNSDEQAGTLRKTGTSWSLRRAKCQQRKLVDEMDILLRKSLFDLKLPLKT